MLADACGVEQVSAPHQRHDGTAGSAYRSAAPGGEPGVRNGRAGVVECERDPHEVAARGAPRGAGVGAGRSVFQAERIPQMDRQLVA